MYVLFSVVKHAILGFVPTIYNIMSLFTQYKIGRQVKNRGINKRKKDTIMYI